MREFLLDMNGEKYVIFIFFNGLHFLVVFGWRRLQIYFDLLCWAFTWYRLVLVLFVRAIYH